MSLHGRSANGPRCDLRLPYIAIHASYIEVRFESDSFVALLMTLSVSPHTLDAARVQAKAVQLSCHAIGRCGDGFWPIPKEVQAHFVPCAQTKDGLLVLLSSKNDGGVRKHTTLREASDLIRIRFELYGHVQSLTCGRVTFSTAEGPIYVPVETLSVRAKGHSGVRAGGV